MSLLSFYRTYVRQCVLLLYRHLLYVLFCNTIVQHDRTISFTHSVSWNEPLPLSEYSYIPQTTLLRRNCHDKSLFLVPRKTVKLIGNVHLSNCSSALTCEI